MKNWKVFAAALITLGFECWMVWLFIYNQAN